MARETRCRYLILPYAGSVAHSQAIESLEIELKFEVPEGAILPSGQDFALVGLTADAAVTHELAAVYYDTFDQRLAAAAVAVRRRRGGGDEGWHVKQRTPNGTVEFQWPLADQAPDDLFVTLEELMGDVRGNLEPRATLNTTRTVIQLRDGHGREMVELADDWVRSMDHRDKTARAWREWEAELAQGGDPVLLDTVGEVLRSAGAITSHSIAKVARASGQLVDLAIRAGSPATHLATVALVDLADRLAANSAHADDERTSEWQHPVPPQDPDPRCAALRQIAANMQQDPQPTTAPTLRSDATGQHGVS